MAESIEVEDNPARNRYEIRVDGALAGVAEYRDRPGARRVFTHTVIDPAFERRGLGGALVRAALDDVRSRGATAVPLCPFVEEFVRRHPEYLDIVEVERRYA